MIHTRERAECSMEKNLNTDIDTAIRTLQSKKKIKRKLVLLCIVIPVSLLLACAVALIYPLFKNPWKETFNSLFFEYEQIENYTDAMQKNAKSISGSINIPSTTTSISVCGTLRNSGEYEGKESVGMFELGLSDGKDIQTQRYVKLGWSREKIFLIYSIYENNDVCVEIPRTDVERSLRESEFYPQSGSKYALTNEQYQELLKALKTIETDDENEKTIGDFFKKIILECIKQSDIKSTYKLFDGGFCISNTVTVKLDRDALVNILDKAMVESRENSAVNKKITPEMLERLFGVKFGNNVKTASDVLDSLRSDLLKADAELEFSYAACKGKLRNIRYSFKHSDDRASLIRDSHIGFKYENDSVSAEAVEMIAEDEKIRSNRFKLERNYKSDSLMIFNEPEEKDQPKILFSYGYKECRYSFDYEGEDSHYTVDGDLMLDAQKDEMKITVDRIYFNKVDMTTDGSFLDLTFAPSEQEPSIPSGMSLFAMTTTEIDVLLDRLKNYLQ